MKELSVEQKAQRYDEAIKRAKSKIKNDKDHVLYEDDVIEIFSELAESEDEKIKQELIEYHKIQAFLDGKPNNKHVKFVAWLEKRGEPQDKGEISDGYHTFNELYFYRMLYNAAFFNMLPKEWVHKSKKHHDGKDCFGGGWFIVMANLPTGQISNHYELKDWDLFQIPEKEVADKWDGHTPQEAADRLHKYLLEKQSEQKSLDDVAKEVTKDKDAAISFLKSCGIMNENGELADEYKIEQGEQKPTEWSVEDENISEAIINYLNMFKRNAKSEIEKALEDSRIVWVHNLKHRISSSVKSAEWSEEDDRHRIHTISLVEDLREWANKDGMHSLCLERCAESIDWLKNIKDRVQPQPEQGWSEENERIKKWLICLLNEMQYHHCDDDREMGNKALAWLEKQGEHKPALEILIKAGLKPYKDGNQWCILVGDNIQEGICGFGDTIEDALYEFLKEVCKPRPKQGEQKHQYKSRPRYVGETELLGEQKPVELGENRSKELSLSLQIQAYLNTASDELYAKGKPLYSEKRIKDIHKCMLMWQKLHNDYFYQKPAKWSEEDEKMLNHIIQFLEDKDRWKDTERAFPIEEDVRWLKSLRPHKQWKPSEKQIEAVRIAAEIGTANNSWAMGILKSMYQDLKKLKG